MRGEHCAWEDGGETGEKKVQEKERSERGRGVVCSRVGKGKRVDEYKYKRAMVRAGARGTRARASYNVRRG